ncbi:MAG: hypothetical protein WAL90_16280, partial [Desulfobacterales bacterium]
MDNPSYDVGVFASPYEEPATPGHSPEAAGAGKAGNDRHCGWGGGICGTSGTRGGNGGGGSPGGPGTKGDDGRRNEFASITIHELTGVLVVASRGGAGQDGGRG